MNLPRRVISSFIIPIPSFILHKSSVPCPWNRHAPHCHEPLTQVGKHWICPEHGQVSIPQSRDDMKHERNALAAEVYPKLEELCQRSGFQFLLGGPRQRRQTP
ncbi:MAG: hypothetical protein ACP5I4_10955 [Oceanipulchritudo sp.]|jgi:hypothetical protein